MLVLRKSKLHIIFFLLKEFINGLVFVIFAVQNKTAYSFFEVLCKIL